MISNRQVMAMLDELVELTTLDEGSPQSFKVRAYERARRAVENLGHDLSGLDQKEIQGIGGIGKSIAASIAEFCETGRVAKLENLRLKYPPAFRELTRIPGLGPKTVKMIRRELGVESLDDLLAALADNRLRDLPGLGATSEAKIARAVDRLGLAGKDRRIPLVTALPIAETLRRDLAGLEGVEAVATCGSARRFRSSVADLDLVVAADPSRRSEVMETVSGHSLVEETLLSGTTKTSVLTRSGLGVDVRVVAPSQLGSAMLYFTGSKAHNVRLRQLAMERNLLLNEYGLFGEGDDRLVASETEEQIYAALGMEWLPPEIREDAGEIEAALDGRLPRLVSVEYIRGDLHFHTDRSGDGRSSPVQMVEAAIGAGMEYVAITDHGEDLAINGLSRAEMKAHRREIARLGERYPEIEILFGCELNIGVDGDLDYDADYRLGFDWCVASVHSHYDLAPRRQTERLLRAVADPAVSAIGHLTGRMLGRRPGIELELDPVLEEMAARGVALEVNGALDRLDASPEVVRRAVAAGVMLVISTDSHHVSELIRMSYGVSNARRGWATADSVLNTLPREEFIRQVRSRRESG
ncbi:MAG: DNA polymerase/3'-5' exonuclease PolX [bacterium]|nr:DNA polymerase/3'-5' exonuclease PolX [bacterium]MDE0601406.1 DNA polymerase/3'-5' exonuclease PolX [bacterium]